MKTHLKAYNLLKYTREELEEGAEENEIRRDSMALSQIHQAIDMSVFGKISTAQTTKQAWDILAKAYRGVDKVQKNNLMALKRKFELATMEKSETVEGYFSRLTEIKNEMELNGHTLSDETFVEKVLNTLPMKFDHIVAVIQETTDLSTLSTEELLGSLILHENRINGKLEESLEKDPTEKALQAHTKVKET